MIENKKNIKILAFYLPQFHTFPENDKWWGKGFTEWKTVKNAQKYFINQYQPRVPLNDNYYNLDDNGDTLAWQSKLAKEYGIYGFCMYHYWFDGKMLMQKPMEILLRRKDIEINYCICWANENWTRAWADKTQEILIEQHYGDSKDWVNHFNYLLQFFKDSRYITIDNKPLFIIYRPEIIVTRKAMLECWNDLAKKNGFNGIYLLYQQNKYDKDKDATAGYLFNGGIEYQPQYVMDSLKNRYNRIPYNLFSLINYICDKYPLFWNKLVSFRFTYDKLWNIILTKYPKKNDMYPGAFVDWDNTPRHKRRGSYCEGVTPQKFQYFLEKLINRTKIIYKKEFIFLFAWNEWGEGGYLEPDEKNNYSYLEAIKNALVNNNEF